MELLFSPVEIRVLGCLIEKEHTTPEAYPLTLNSLTRACNQVSNREPVMQLSETEVQQALDRLGSQLLISTRSGSDSRVIKYSHRMRERRTPEFDFDQAELAVLSVLLLRGPQTAGEIRTRALRIHAFEDTGAVIATLERLAARDDGPYAIQLARQAGQKESRYAHLFAGKVAQSAPSTGAPRPVPRHKEDEQDRAGLLQRVEELEQELASLQQRFEQFTKQFD